MQSSMSGQYENEESLTVVVGNDVGHIDLAVTVFLPHASAGSARVGVPLIRRVNGDVSHKLRLIKVRSCRKETAAETTVVTVNQYRPAQE